MCFQFYRTDKIYGPRVGEKMRRALKTRTSSIINSYLELATVFCASQPPFMATAAIVASDIFETRDEGPDAKLRENIATFRHAMGTVKAEQLVRRSDYQYLPASYCRGLTASVLGKPAPIVHVTYEGKNVNQWIGLQSSMNGTIPVLAPLLQQNCAGQTKPVSHNAFGSRSECSDS